MTVNTLSSAAEALKIVYDQNNPYDTLMKTSMGFSMIQQNKRKNFQFGLYGEFSVKVMSGGIAEALGAGEVTLPTGKAVGWQKPKVYPCNIYGNVSFDVDTVNQATNNRAAFGNLVDQIKGDAMDTMAKSMSAQYYKDKVGNLTTFSDTSEKGGSSGAYIYKVTDPNIFVEGMTVDFLTSAGADISNGTTVQITKVDKRNSQITVDATSAPTIPNTSAFITFSNSYNNSMTGLQYLLNDADYSDDYYGVSRSTYPTLALDMSLGGSSIGALSDLTLDMFWEFLDMPEEIGASDIEEGGTRVILTTRELKRKIASILHPQSRFDGKLQAGYELDEINNDGQKIKLKADPRCPKSYIYNLLTSSFETYESRALDWLQLYQGQSAYFRLKATSSAYEGFPLAMLQLVCTNPRKNAVLRYVS